MVKITLENYKLKLNIPQQEIFLKNKDFNDKRNLAYYLINGNLKTLHFSEVEELENKENNNNE